MRTILEKIFSNSNKIEKQFLAINDSNWKEKNLSNKWVKTYYDVIEQLINVYSRKIDNFNKLKKYFRNGEIKNHLTDYGWKWCRHHIDEIKISGSIYQSKFRDLYDTGVSILITVEEHFLLHYIIVMADQTFPNNGMLISLSKFDNPKNEWDQIVQKMCQIFNVEYDSSWLKKLS